MRIKKPIEELHGADLALWAARAHGIEERRGIKLYASGPCLYRDTGPGGEPFAFRPDTWLNDAAPLIQEMTASGDLTLSGDTAYLKAEGFGEVGFSGGQATAVTRCYIAWKLGREFTAESTN